MSRAEAIRAALSGPDLARLFAAVRRGLEGRGPEGARSVTLRDLGEAERRALADLHGWALLPEGQVRVRLDRLDAALRSSRLAASLVEVVEALAGPLGDRRAESAEARARTEAMWEAAARHPGVAARPELARWLEEIRARGLLGRAARASAQAEEALLEATLSVVARLPAAGAGLSALAAEALADAHGLDPGRPVAGLALRAAARLAGWPAVPADAAGRRRLWAEVGVACDPLSSQVLVLGLAPAGEGRLARGLREAAAEGEPARLTLREIRRAGALDAAGRAVFVCENPAVVAAAADRLGARSGPLLCTEGVPSTAALELLESLTLTGSPLFFRADFDWPGLRIAAAVARLDGARPWRFGAADYEAALAAAEGAPPLRGAPSASPWDPALSATMASRGRAVFEEGLLHQLLEDLDGAG